MAGSGARYQPPLPEGPEYTLDYTGEILTVPATTTGHKILWMARVDDTDSPAAPAWVPYTASENMAMDAAFTATLLTVTLQGKDETDDPRVVSFQDMVQRNSRTNRARRIQRVSILKQ
jgi:hypothetical protein